MTARAEKEGAQHRRGLQAFASFGSTPSVQGTFYAMARRVLMPGFTRFRHVGPSFECSYLPEIAELQRGDPFVLLGIGMYLFRREVKCGGDDFGRTVIELSEA